MSKRPWMTLERFDCSPLAGRWAVVRMLAALEAELRPPAGARLFVRRGPAVSSHGAFVSAADRRDTGATSELLWIASFAVPLEIVEYPGALFELCVPGRPVLSLPAPGTLVLQARRGDPLPDRRWLPSHARRRVGALATVVAVSTASIPASGLAADRTAHGIVKNPLDAHGIVKNPLDPHGIVKKPLDPHGIVKKPLDAHGIVKNPLDAHKLLAKDRRRPPRPGRDHAPGPKGREARQPSHGAGDRRESHPSA